MDFFYFFCRGVGVIVVKGGGMWMWWSASEGWPMVHGQLWRSMKLGH